VYVWRDDPNSRQNTIKEIVRRATSTDGWQQVLIFPEGTCSNRTGLITFKPGAFYPGVPIQPVCIRYPNRLDTLSWTWQGPGAYVFDYFYFSRERKLMIYYLKFGAAVVNVDPVLHVLRAGIPPSVRSFRSWKTRSSSLRQKCPQSHGRVSYYFLVQVMILWDKSTISIQSVAITGGGLFVRRLPRDEFG
jgi:hypothetical protein